MEIKKVEEMPISIGRLQECNQKIYEAMTEMKEGETIKVTPPKDKKAQNIVTGIKNLRKRFPAKNFLIKVNQEEIYIHLKKQETKRNTEERK